MRAFFPTYKEEFTKTPNIFFDHILFGEEKDETGKNIFNLTLNDVRIVGFLIRYTVGYQKDAKWLGVTRDDLIKKAKVSNTQLSHALKHCIEKEWVLEYMKDKKTRYLFLNDETNQKIVFGLRQGLFEVEDLIYLNEAGVKALLEKHHINSPETGESELYGNGRVNSPERGESSLRKGESQVYGKGRVKSTDTVEIKSAPAQVQQGFADSLKTIIKDNNNKDISKDNNKEIAVAIESDDSELQAHMMTLKSVVGDKVSDASIRTWLSKGSVDRVMKCWFKAQEQSGIGDIGAYVTSLLKMNVDQELTFTSKQVFTAQEEVAATSTQNSKYDEFYKSYNEQDAGLHDDEIMPAEIATSDSITDLEKIAQAKELWTSVLFDLEMQLSKPSFMTWFKNPDVEPLMMDHDTLIVQVPNEHHRQWVESRFSVQCKSAVEKMAGKSVAVKFVIAPSVQQA